jgi:hypothetical protein
MISDPFVQCSVESATLKFIGITSYYIPPIIAVGYFFHNFDSKKDLSQHIQDTASCFFGSITGSTTMKLTQEAYLSPFFKKTMGVETLETYNPIEELLTSSFEVIYQGIKFLYQNYMQANFQLIYEQASIVFPNVGNILNFQRTFLTNTAINELNRAKWVFISNAMDSAPDGVNIGVFGSLVLLPYYAQNLYSNQSEADLPGILVIFSPRSYEKIPLSGWLYTPINSVIAGIKSSINFALTTGLSHGAFSILRSVSRTLDLGTAPSFKSQKFFSESIGFYFTMYKLITDTAYDPLSPSCNDLHYLSFANSLVSISLINQGFRNLSPIPNIVTFLGLLGINFMNSLSYEQTSQPEANYKTEVSGQVFDDDID